MRAACASLILVALVSGGCEKITDFERFGFDARSADGGLQDGGASGCSAWFCDDFESGLNAASWTLTGDVRLEQISANDHVLSIAAGAAASTPFLRPDGYLRARIYVLADAPTSVGILGLEGPNHYRFALDRGSDTALRVSEISPVSGTLRVNVGGSFEVGQWVCLGLRVGLDRVELWLNDALSLAFPAEAFWTDQALTLRFGFESPNGTDRMKIDDVIIGPTRITCAD